MSADGDCVRELAPDEVPERICKLCSAHSDFEVYLQTAADADSHAQGRRHLQLVGQVRRSARRGESE